MSENPFAVENLREIANTIKAVAVEVKSLKKHIIQLKKLQNITRKEIRNPEKLKPIK